MQEVGIVALCVLSSLVVGTGVFLATKNNRPDDNDDGPPCDAEMAKLRATLASLQQQVQEQQQRNSASASATTIIQQQQPMLPTSLRVAIDPNAGYSAPSTYPQVGYNFAKSF